MNTLIKENQVIDNFSELLSVFYSGIKKAKALGVEFEKIPVYQDNYTAVEFFFQNGMLDFLTQYQKTNKFVPNYENDILLGLLSNFGTISLEPGAQLEYSLPTFENISDIEKSIDDYNTQTGKLAQEMGIKFLALGLQPVSTFQNIKIIPKLRYEFMTKYLKNVASLPFVMMRESAGIQVSIDYSCEEDAILKLSTALMLSPFLSAFFQNSPIRNGKLTKYKSFRAHAWLNTDEKRCGLVSSKLFEKNLDFSFTDYAKILLNIPMIFHKNNFVGNLSFNELFLNHNATLADWLTHISLYFPDVRLKNYIEIRNHDCQKKEYALAIPALYKGIFYSADGINKIRKLFCEFNYYDFQFVRHNAPRYGLDFKINNKQISQIVLEIFNIAKEGLKEFNNEEEKYLEASIELLKENKNPADILIQNFEGSWNKKIHHLVNYSQIS